MNGIELRIALRYLFARKSNNVINWISAICVAGIAIGTAALILILSVYNGFDREVRANLGRTDSPYLLVCDSSKFFESPVSCGLSVLSDKVIVEFDGSQTIAVAKGVEGCVAPAVSEDLALSVGYRPQFSQPLRLLYPSAGAPVSLLNPGASIRHITLHASSVFRPSSDAVYPEVILPLEDMRRLCNVETAVTGVQLNDYVDVPGFSCLNSEQQHPSVLKMLKMEKLALYLILVCVVVIVTFNIFSSLRLLQIEKTTDCATLMSLGLTSKGVQRIFIYEGILITVLSLVIGLVVGLLLCLLQSSTGLVIMPGLSQPYPVDVHFFDVLICCVSVLFIGVTVSVYARIIPARRQASR